MSWFAYLCAFQFAKKKVGALLAAVLIATRIFRTLRVRDRVTAFYFWARDEIFGIFDEWGFDSHARDELWASLKEAFSVETWMYLLALIFLLW